MQKNLRLVGVFLLGVIVSGCLSQRSTQVAVSSAQAENSCQQHCNLNYAACMDTANSPDARQECIDSRYICYEGC
jgi:hypothetical protein